MSLVQSAPPVDVISGDVVSANSVSSSPVLDSRVSGGAVSGNPSADSSAPGGLLQELERRQDDVLAQIDELDAKLTAILGELGVNIAADSEDA